MRQRRPACSGAGMGIRRRAQRKYTPDSEMEMAQYLDPTQRTHARIAWLGKQARLHFTPGTLVWIPSSPDGIE